MRDKPVPDAARVAMVAIGKPRISGFMRPSEVLAKLPHVAVVVIDFYPVDTSRCARISNKQEA